MEDARNGLASSGSRSAERPSSPVSAVALSPRATGRLPLLLGSLLLFTLSGAAQQTGRIVGRILNVEGGIPIASAAIEVTGSAPPIGTHSAVDGHYALKVPVGTVTLLVRRVGFSPKLVTGVVVPANGTVEQDITLTVKELLLETMVVTSTKEKSTVAGALNAQRSAANITSAISAQQIAQSPDGDAGAAVKRVSGVSVVDGKYVLVRGLGERYTTTSLNGARVPSPEPDHKVVPMDLFPANMLSGISTSKTFTPDQPADFSGASVNITTREFPANHSFGLTLGSGWNSAATGATLDRAPTAGGEWMGNGAPPRALPSNVEAAGNLTGLTQAEVNSLIGSFRNVWAPVKENGLPNAQMNVALGGEDPVFGQPIGYLGSFTYTFLQDVQADQVKGLAKKGTAAGTAEPLNTYTGSTAMGSVLWGALLNMYTRLGESGRISFNNTFTRSADNEAQVLGGLNEEFADTFAFARLAYIQRAVRSNQLAGQHLVGMRTNVNWSVTNSAVSRDEPDRSDIGYRAHPNGDGTFSPYEWFGQARFATRSFLSTTESSWNLALDADHAFSDLPNALNVKAGAAYFTASRSSSARAYDMVNLSLSTAALQQTPEAIFSTSNIDASSFLMTANTNGGEYTADDRVLAGFAMVTVPISERMSLMAGVRVEDWNLEVDTRTASGQVYPSNPHHTDVLPAVSFTYRYSDDQLVRLSATQTLARPEYRELSPVPYFEQVGFATTFGNPSLDRTLIQNYDARWEWYPAPGAIVSTALFYKSFTSPIEKVFIQSTGANNLSFVNADGATNYGVEVDIRGELGGLGGLWRGVTAFGNATVMRSEIRIGNDSISAATNPDRPMLGQSPYVVNAGLTWASRSGRSTASVLYNVAGARILEVGSGGLPDAYEQPRHVIDASVEVPLARDFSVKLDGRNLLDSRYLMTQGGVTRLQYSTGRVFVLLFHWQR